MQAENQIPQAVKEITQRLEAYGFEAFAVGGCARDLLLGRTPNDWDVTTNALPAETAEAFGDRKIIETGIKHGTVTVLTKDMPIEITTYRIDGEYTDNRHPDSVSFTKSLREDMKRRDFTMNAIAIDANGSLRDYFGGEEDIKNRLIRCVGKPDERFNEDALRIMRALRFASVLGFEIEKETEKSIKKNKNLLLGISAERLREEFIKLLCGKDCRRILTEYYEVLGVFIPEILPCAGFDQRNRYHIYNVLEHIAAVTENIPPEPTLRLAAFFHDIEKPSCYFLGEDGQGHFYGHGKKSAETAEKIMKRLRMDNRTINEVKTLVLIHDNQIVSTERATLRVLRKIGKELFFKLLEVKKADTLGQNPEYRGRLDEIEKIREIGERVLSEEKCFSLGSLAVGGNDIINEGFGKGREIGKILDSLLSAVIDGKCENSREELLKYARKMKK